MVMSASVTLKIREDKIEESDKFRLLGRGDADGTKMLHVNSTNFKKILSSQKLPSTLIFANIFMPTRIGSALRFTKLTVVVVVVVA